MPTFRKIWPWAGLVVGLGLLAWMLRDIDLARLGNVAVTARPWPIAALIALVLCDGLLRAEKWRHMILPLGRIATRRLFGAIMAGYFANLLIPVRVSPLVRAWLAARLEGLRTGALLATVALDRMIDGIVFLTFCGIALLWLQFPAASDVVRGGVMWGGFAGGVLLVVAFGLLIGMRFGLAGALRAILALPAIRRLPARSKDGASPFIGDFGDGVVWPQAWWRGVFIVVDSIVIKLVQLSYFWWAGLACGIALPPWSLLYLMVFLGFLTIIAGALRIVGGFTAGGVFALGSLGLDTETALAMTLLVQLAINMTIVGVGLPALWAQGLGVRALRARGEDPP